MPHIPACLLLKPFPPFAGSFQEFTIYVIELLTDNKALYKPCTTFKVNFAASPRVAIIAFLFRDVVVRTKRIRGKLTIPQVKED